MKILVWESGATRRKAFVVLLLCLWFIQLVEVSRGQPENDDFPIGMTFVYDNGTSYTVLRWIENSHQVVEIASNDDVFSVYLPEWKILAEPGEPERRFPWYPLWQNTSDWVLGQRLSIPQGGPEYRLQQFVNVQSCLGSSSCWEALYRGSYISHHYSTNYTFSYRVYLYYDTDLGVLVSAINSNLTQASTVLTSMGSTYSEAQNDLVNSMDISIIAVIISEMVVVALIFDIRHERLQDS